MLSKLAKWTKKTFSKPRTPSEIDLFMAKHEMTFHGFGGLNIHSMLVREFGYLLRYITDKKIDSLSDFRVIANNSEMINLNIKRELSKDVLRESEALGVSRQTAEGNMTRLRGIVNVITQYTAMCDRLGADLYAAREKEACA